MKSQTWFNYSHLRSHDKSLPDFITNLATSTSRKQHKQPSIF